VLGPFRTAPFYELPAAAGEPPTLFFLTLSPLFSSLDRSCVVHKIRHIECWLSFSFFVISSFHDDAILQAHIPPNYLMPPPYDFLFGSPPPLGDPPLPLPPPGRTVITSNDASRPTQLILPQAPLAPRPVSFFCLSPNFRMTFDFFI